MSTFSQPLIPLAAFPEPCRFAIETLAEVYHHDEVAKERNFSPDERLKFHQEKSAPLMTELKAWLEAQLEEKKVEPNSGLGKAIRYMLKHWAPLTMFLRIAGAPLDNNLCERCLKMVVLHRKNSLFYKTPLGAFVGDLFMTLIYTCRQMRVNPFDYLTTLLRHHQTLSNDPGRWLPWNYNKTVEALLP